MAKNQDNELDGKLNLWEKLMRRKKAIFVVIVLLSIAFLVLRYFYQKSQPPEHKTAIVERSTLSKIIDVSGKMEAEETVNLKFPSVGRLGWVGVKEGDEVKKWQAVASLDRRTLEKQLKQDLIGFEKEYRDYQQDVDDYPNVNQRLKRILEKAQFDLTSSVIDVEIQNLAIELATLVSPIDGIVTRVDTPYAGVNVAVTDTITIVNPSTLYFEVEVDESDIAAVSIGQKANVSLDAFSDEKFAAEVSRIDFQSSTSSGGGTVFKVRLNLTNADGQMFRLGMSGDADIVLEEKSDVLVIPTEFLIERDDKYYVEQFGSGNELKRVEIEVGTITDDYTEIISGLSESEPIILTK